jgi:hypothetical protein
MQRQRCRQPRWSGGNGGSPSSQSGQKWIKVDNLYTDRLGFTRPAQIHICACNNLFKKGILKTIRQYTVGVQSPGGYKVPQTTVYPSGFGTCKFIIYFTTNHEFSYSFMLFSRNFMFFQYFYLVLLYRNICL